MQKFTLGQVVATRGALYELEKASINPLELIGRHARLDQGCLGAGDQAANQHALIDQTRVFSAYLCKGVKYYVVTEWDRSITTLMLASDY